MVVQRLNKMFKKLLLTLKRRYKLLHYYKNIIYRLINSESIDKGLIYDKQRKKRGKFLQ